ncbi:MAG: hypothetical protein GQ581_10545 [Methyloprofundus sp.]|nr:hypothetical protein [Methyloprofundus sp.]
MNILQKKMGGFSILEALIASIVVGVGMLGLAKLQGITLANSSESRLRTDALNLAQEKIEQLRTFSNQTTYDALANAADTSVGSNATFTRNWTITGCSNAVSCQRASVTVTWVDQAGATQTVQLTSYIAQADPVKAGVVLATGP